MGFSFRAVASDTNTYDYVVALSGVTGTAIINTRTLVSAGSNLAPTANAGGDQSVASEAAGVLLAGSGTDPEGQNLIYAWTQTGGTSVTLSSSTAAGPTFTAPTLNWNAPDAQLTFALIVNDGVQDSPADAVVITVTAPVDTSRPTVTLAGMPASVMPGDVVAVSVSFSEPVTGLVAADFDITNGTSPALSGSGSSYTLMVEATGIGALSVTLPADQAADVAQNGNEASNTVEATSGVTDVTETEIAEYLQRRANALVAAQPGLIRHLDPAATPEVSVSTKGFSFATGAGRSVWASLTGQWGESGPVDTRYLLGAIGAHGWLTDRTILGLMLEFDHMRQREADRRIEGTGWLIGPYVAGQVQDQPLFYEGRLLWGQSRNEISLFGPALVDTFDSTRFLAQVKLQGEFKLGEAIAAPFIDASYVSDTQEAYIDGFLNAIPEQEIRQSQLALGFDLRQAFVVSGGVLTPTAGFTAVYSETTGTGAAALVDPVHDGWRSRLKAGVTFARGQSQFDASAYLDGLGTEDYRDYGLTLGFATRF